MCVYVCYMCACSAYCINVASLFLGISKYRTLYTPMVVLPEHPGSSSIKIQKLSDLWVSKVSNIFHSFSAAFINGSLLIFENAYNMQKTVYHIHKLSFIISLIL